jgi:hypothetical protein
MQNVLSLDVAEGTQSLQGLALAADHQEALRIPPRVDSRVEVGRWG